jgi:hypothetical protein
VGIVDNSLFFSTLRLFMRVAYFMSFAHFMACGHLCAALIVIHDEYDSRPYEPVTSFQQPKEVTKKGRPPARLYSLCVSTNTGRENAFPTRLSLRLHPCNRPSVSLRCSGSLESVNKACASRTGITLRYTLITGDKERYLRLFFCTGSPLFPVNTKILDVFRISTKACLRNGKNLTCTTSYGVC